MSPYRAGSEVSRFRACFPIEGAFQSLFTTNSIIFYDGDPVIRISMPSDFSARDLLYSHPLCSIESTRLKDDLIVRPTNYRGVDNRTTNTMAIDDPAHNLGPFQSNPISRKRSIRSFVSRESRFFRNRLYSARWHAVHFASALGLAGWNGILQWPIFR